MRLNLARIRALASAGQPNVYWLRRDSVGGALGTSTISAVAVAAGGTCAARLG
ncbi:hypothetical protein [Micromonospora parva]|uniref:hypothetical protein n=1 Tax=Micromonospora parva TaxID=1464048 RepID=UPI0033D856EA